MILSNPVFIIGSARSGTTLLRLILDSHPNISCGPETQFLREFESITTRHWPLVKGFGFEQEYWYRHVASFFNTFQLDYAESRGKIRWAEKSPVNTLRLDFINKLFPDSQFIHLIRDGRDVVKSHQDRWGYRMAIRATKKWRKYTTLARDFGKSISSHRYREIRYEHLVTNPESTLRDLFDFLQEPWSDNVLHYDNQPHHHSSEVFNVIAETRRKEGGNDALIYTSRIGAGKQTLDPLLKLLFIVRSGKFNKELGYY